MISCVQAIDDQYVLACDVDGNVLAGSTIVDALLDRHGANSGRIADSLLGGHQVGFSEIESHEIYRLPIDVQII